MAYHRQQGVDTGIVRTFNTYGSRMRPHDGRAIPTFLRQALQDKPLTVFGDGSQTRSFCYVDDQIRGYVAMAESDVHEPVNIGNPNEFTLLELAQVVIEVTESRSEIVYEALPTDDPQVRQPEISRAKDLLGWEPRGRAARRAADDDRADRRRAPRRHRRLAALAAGASGPLRIAHLTATFPPYPRRRRQHRVSLRPRAGRARPSRRGLHRAGHRARRPIPGAAIVHRIDPVFAIGNAPLIPRLARDRGLRRRPPPLPVHLRLRAHAARRGWRAAADATGAARPLQEPARRKGRRAGRCSRPTSTRSRRALIRAADRVCVLSPDHAESVAYLRAGRRARPGEADRDAERRRRRAVRARRRTLAACARGSGSPPTPSSPLSSPPSTAPTTSSASTSRSTRSPRLEAGDVHLVVAGGGELLDGFRERARAAGVGDRVHFLGAVPHAELPDVLRAADLFLLTTEPPESFGIVLIEAMACGLPAIATDYPGVRGRGRRRRDRAAGRAGRCGRGRRGARRARRGPRGRGPRWASAGARRRCASGAGRSWSTAWTPPTPRRSPPGGEGRARDAPAPDPATSPTSIRRARDTGVLRPAAMASGCAGSATR